MPALDYDYDYYEYRNGRRVGSAAIQTRSATSTNRTSVARRTPSQMTRTTTARRTAPTVKRQVTTNKSNATKKNVTTKNKMAAANKVSNTKKSKIDIPLESANRIKNKPEKMSLKAPKVQAKPKTSFVSALKNVALVSIFFSLFFLICYRYSLINEEFSDIKTLKNDLEKIQTTNEQLQADIESKTDLTYVENYAKYQLGMQKPANSQIQYVRVEKQDKITTPVTIDEGKELNWFENIVNEIRKILD